MNINDHLRILELNIDTTELTAGILKKAYYKTVFKYDDEEKFIIISNSVNELKEYLKRTKKFCDPDIKIYDSYDEMKTELRDIAKKIKRINDFRTKKSLYYIDLCISSMITLAFIVIIAIVSEYPKND